MSASPTPASAPAAAAAKPAYSPGLEGIIAGESAICSLDNEAGLSYRGYGIYDLASHSPFPEIVYLLFNGELPTKQQLEQITKQLSDERNLPTALSRCCGCCRKKRTRWTRCVPAC